MNFNPEIPYINVGVLQIITAFIVSVWVVIAYRTLRLWRALVIPELQDPGTLPATCLQLWRLKRPGWIAVMSGLTSFHGGALLLGYHLYSSAVFTVIDLSIFHGYLVIACFVSMVLKDKVREYGEQRNALVRLHELTKRTCGQ